MGNTSSTKQNNISKGLPGLSIPFGKNKGSNEDPCLAVRKLKTDASDLSIGQRLAVVFDDNSESFWLVNDSLYKIKEIGKRNDLLKCISQGYIYRAKVKDIKNQTAEIEIEGALR